MELLMNDTLQIRQLLCKDFLYRPKPFESLLKIGERRSQFILLSYLKPLWRSYEKTASEFFLTVKHYLRSTPATGVLAFAKWTKAELDMNENLEKCKERMWFEYLTSPCNCLWKASIL